MFCYGAKIIIHQPISVTNVFWCIVLNINKLKVVKPGQSICMEQYLYHRFYGEPGKGKVMVGEVSQCNDDTTDNRFYAPVGRFPEIEEDEQPLHLLCSDYPKFLV